MKITIIVKLTIKLKQMKNCKSLLLLLGTLAILGATMSATPKPLMEEKDILIVPQPPVSPNPPRSFYPVIQAYYDTDLYCICATLSNAGTLVDVEIENRTTGETSACQISGNNTSIIPISGTSGNWVITFTLTGGDVYYGEFML